MALRSFDKEKKTIVIDGKDYEAIQLTKEEQEGIIDYLKMLQKKKKKDDGEIN